MSIKGYLFREPDCLLTPLVFTMAKEKPSELRDVTWISLGCFLLLWALVGI